MSHGLPSELPQTEIATASININSLIDNYKLGAYQWGIFILCGLCLGSVFLSYQLAASPPSPAWTDTWPALMAWIPIFIFGPLSVWLLDRIKT